MPPVVFVGPSAPAWEIRSILPDAIIRPPASRGDLYAYRILRHGYFLLLDGLFGGVLSISPREVVDVVQDGAVVVGASSMGALRAADCRPAGVLGAGIIYRLFKDRVISNEDEVAVLFREEMPFPSLTEPLINMRIALRRAIRKGLVEASEAEKIIVAAQSLHFSRRTWSSACRRANLQPPSGILGFLREIDTKRSDAIKAARLVSRLLKADNGSGRQFGSSRLFGLLGSGRERSADPLSGADFQQIEPEFIEWLLCSGRAYIRLRNEINRQSGEFTVPISLIWHILRGSGEFEAYLMKFNIYQRAVSEAKRRGLRPESEDLRQAERQLADDHGAASWNDLVQFVENDSPYSKRLRTYLGQLALTKCLRRKYLITQDQAAKAGEVLLWKPR